MEVTFAQKIRELRNAKDWSVYDLAGRIEKTPGYISKIEARGEIPSPEMIIKLASVLGADTEQLLDVAKKEKGEKLKRNVERKYDEAFTLYRKKGKKGINR